MFSSLARRGLVRALPSPVMFSTFNSTQRAFVTSQVCRRTLAREPLRMVQATTRSFSTESSPSPPQGQSKPPTDTPSKTQSSPSPSPSPAPAPATPPPVTPEPAKSSNEEVTNKKEETEAPEAAPPKSKKDGKQKKETDGKNSFFSTDLVEQGFGWFHTFTKVKAFSVSFGHLGVLFRDMLIRKAFSNISQNLNKDLAADDVVEGAKQVYKILHAIAFHGEDSARLTDAITPAAASTMLRSLDNIKNGKVKIIGELHDIVDVRFVTLSTEPVTRNSKEFSILVGLQLETIESYEVLSNGTRSIKEDRATQYPLLFLESPLFIMHNQEEREETGEIGTPLPLQWKLSMGPDRE
eukprot:m.94740 g.94740  ORF g.94740 m.94740 type:complete len:352 (+) comp13870_c0_seq4:1237-2292(+)